MDIHVKMFRGGCIEAKCCILNYNSIVLDLDNYPENNVKRHENTTEAQCTHISNDIGPCGCGLKLYC